MFLCCVWQVIRDYKLLLMVAILLVVDVIILSLWQAIDPTRRKVKLMQPEVRATLRRSIFQMTTEENDQSIHCWSNVDPPSATLAQH